MLGTLSVCTSTRSTEGTEHRPTDSATYCPDCTLHNKVIPIAMPGASCLEKIQRAETAEGNSAHLHSTNRIICSSSGYHQHYWEQQSQKASSIHFSRSCSSFSPSPNFFICHLSHPNTSSVSLAILARPTQHIHVTLLWPCSLGQDCYHHHVQH